MPLIQLLHADTYLSMIKGSANTQMYRHAYALVDGIKTDLTNNGEYSCAFFVGDLLRRFRLTNEPHLRVQGLVKDMIDSGWVETTTPKTGDVITYEPKTESDGTSHLHVAFYLGEDQAFGNLTSKGAPGQHHMTFGMNADGTPIRRTSRFFTHPTFFADASYRL